MVIQPSRLVLIVPGLVSASESVLRDPPHALRALSEVGSVSKVWLSKHVSTPESAFLGLDPSRFGIEEGPLTVSAFGYDPPARSVQFHLSVMSVNEKGLVELPQEPPSQKEIEVFKDCFERLKSKRLVAVLGHGLDHGLVWEDGSIDLESHPPEKVVGHHPFECLPKGDGEPMLRAFIDDSINLLSELEFNKIRLEEGKQALNLLWPWGHGFRVPLPNLAVQRGTSASVISRSLRLRGLSRLVGYRPSSPKGDRGALFVPEGAWKHVQPDLTTQIALVPGFEDCRRLGRTDEAARSLLEIDKALLEPWYRAEGATRLLVVALDAGGGDGIALSYDSDLKTKPSAPFDERALEEARVSRFGLHEVIADFLEPDASP